MSGKAEKAGDPGARLFAAWERATAEMISTAAHDPRTLVAGAGALRASLLSARAGRAAWQAWCAPWRALVDRGRKEI